MAEVSTPTIANEKSSNSLPKKKIFGVQKSPDLIIYRMITPNEKIRDDSPLYPPYRRFPNYDIIEWEGGSRAIRWLPGETSIFVDEQEKNGRVVPDGVVNNPNNRFEIIDGEIRVPPHQKTKIQFLDLCNRNADSEHRTGSVQPLFRRYSEERKVADMKAKQSKQKEALDKAYEASDEQIAFHAKYLGIPMFDHSTSATRTPDAIITDYRQAALDKPDDFLKTYDDEDLKLKYQIEKGIEENFISLKVIPGKAVYTSSKQEICDVPLGQEINVVVDSLFIFATGKSGSEFFKKISNYGK
jgi:hypothetical protein